MTIRSLTDPAARLVRAPDDGTGAAPPPATDATPAAADAPAPWWSTLPEDTQVFVKAKGLDARKPDEALPAVLDMARNAEKKLGKPLDRLLERPKDGQALSDWLAENRATLGLPEAVDGYTLAPPKDFPEGLWNADLAGRAAQLAHKHGLPPAALADFVALQAEAVLDLDRQAGAALAEAQGKLRDELTRDWGDAFDARATAARQAFDRLATEAGLPEDARLAAAAMLSAKAGDAGAVRLFDALARMMADDRAVGLGQGAGQTTVADAQARLDAMKAPGSDYAKALERARVHGDRREFERLDAERTRLTQIVVGAKGG